MSTAILGSIGLTRATVLRIAASFPKPRTAPEAEPLEGKRGCTYSSIVLAALVDGPKTTSELADASGTNDDGIRQVLKRLAAAGKILRCEPGRPGVGGQPAKWRLA